PREAAEERDEDRHETREHRHHIRRHEHTSIVSLDVHDVTGLRRPEALDHVLWMTATDPNRCRRTPRIGWSHAPLPLFLRALGRRRHDRRRDTRDLSAAARGPRFLRPGSAGPGLDAAL